MKKKHGKGMFMTRAYGHSGTHRVLKVCLASFVILIFAGCESNEEKALKRAQVQFSSHIDQAGFFMNQGQLKAAMLEAQNARKLLPAKPEPYLLMADALLTTGDARQALEVYQELLGQDEAKSKPESAKIDAAPADLNTARLGLARTQMLLGDIPAATAALDALSEPTAEQQAAASVLRGNLALAKRELTDAEAFYRKAIEQNAVNIDAYIGLSKVSFIKEDMDATNDAITKAASIQAESSELWLWKAQFAASQNRFGEAEAAYIKALEKIGQYDVMTMQKYQTISQLVEALRAQSKFAEAFTYQEILDKSGPGNIRSNYEQALEAIQASDLDKAEGLLLSILESAPGHKQAGIMLGIVKFQQGEWAMADMYLSQYGGDNVNDVVARVMAETKLHMKEPEAAKALMSGLPRETSDNLSIYGMAEIATGNLSAGIEALEKALVLDEGNIGILEQLTKALLKEGKPDQALQVLEQAIVRSPDQEKIRSMIVAVNASQEDWTNAEKAITAWKRRTPGSALASNAEGALLMQQDKNEEAIRAFEKAKKSRSTLATPYFNLIRLYLSQEENALALTEARSGVQNMPGNMMMIRSYLDLASRQEQLEEGVEFLRSVAEQGSNSAPSLVLAEYYGRTNQFKDARAFLNRARDSGADAAAVEGLELMLAETEIPLLIQAKRLDQARKLADSMGSSYPSSPEAQLLRAKVELSAGDEKAGFDQLDRINRKYPQQPIAFEFLGDYYFSKESFEKAVDVYQKAWLRIPSQSLAIKMHRALREANSTVKSLEPLKQWLEISPDSPQASTLLAMGYQAAGMNEDAIKLYEKIKKSRPSDAVALNNLAWLYYERKDERALETAAEAYRLRPDNSAIADTYALVLLQQTKETAKAIEILEKAIAAEPDNEELKTHLEEARAATAKSS